MFDELTGLKNIYDAIEHADQMVQAYLEGGKSGGKVAVAALSHPMKGFQGIVEGLIFDIDPSALD